MNGVKCDGQIHYRIFYNHCVCRGRRWFYYIGLWYLTRNRWNHDYDMGHLKYE